MESITYLDYLPEELMGEITIYIHSYNNLIDLSRVSEYIGHAIIKSLYRSDKKYARRLIIPYDKSEANSTIEILKEFHLINKVYDFKFYIYPGICFVFKDYRYSILGIERLPSEEGKQYTKINEIKQFIDNSSDLVYRSMIDINKVYDPKFKIGQSGFKSLHSINNDFIKFCLEADFGLMNPHAPQSVDNSPLKNYINLIVSNGILNRTMLMYIFSIYVKHNKLDLVENKRYHINSNPLFNKYFRKYLILINLNQEELGKKTFNLDRPDWIDISTHLVTKLMHIDKDTFNNFNLPGWNDYQLMTDELNKFNVVLQNINKSLR